MRLIRIIKTFLVIIFTFLWSFTIIGTTFQRNSIGEKSKDIPIYLFSYNKDTLDSIKKQTTNMAGVKSSELTSNDEIVDKLINKYELDEIKNYVERNKIPHVLYIQPNKKIFILENFHNLFELLEKNENEIIINFNQEIYEVNQSDYVFFDKSIDYINITFSFLLLLLTTFFHFYDKIEKKRYREIYIASGGNPKDLIINLWIRSLVFVIATTILNYFFVQVISKKLDLILSYRFLILQFLVLLFAFFFANLIKDK